MWFFVYRFRPQLIVGPNHGVVMNLPPIVGVYAAMRKKEGLPLSFPGGADWVWEAVDVRLVGDACLWGLPCLKPSRCSASSVDP